MVSWRREAPETLSERPQIGARAGEACARPTLGRIKEDEECAAHPFARAAATMAIERILRVTEGPLAGSVYVLDADTTLGRGADADIQLLDPTASRKHAALAVDADGALTLVDLGSHNGTYVDRRRVRRAITVRPGQEIRIGDYAFVYEEAPASGRAPGSAPARPARARVRGSDKPTASRPTAGDGPSWDSDPVDRRGPRRGRHAARQRGRALATDRGRRRI